MTHPSTGLHRFFLNSCWAFHRSITYSIGILLVLFSFFSYSATPEQIAQIQTAAEQYVIDHLEPPRGGQLSARAASIDTRVKASDCPDTLETSSSNIGSSSSNVTVLVQCQADNWRMYVPVRVSTAMPLITATRNLARGELIDQADIAIEMIDLHRFRRQGFTDSSHVVGAKVKRNIRPGNAIERNDICIVCRNEKVVIQAVKGTMTITTRGTALSDGSAGDQVRVKNDKSQRIIEGQVTGIGQITIQL
ncbi:flagella basal body P-ring formation protein FlgA [Vibrio sp. 10N.286.49.B3]|uniref:flagellar basal body P-ring formation chaperone FlgA n=1 Tax=Vibrio sp. 10N.286.49.B3 TaxID=1880855 RepID=UPI000C82535F|nr:flagellar basal body P-ring formation chaperone FlgA [Vibrio sp. 10N.286.49.B3]PMH41000.1 flagella basal body P-ring formation protein FlgA [Vibrio sp. 10N.286.49.B3]